MENYSPTQMTDIELKKLETRVDDLLGTCDQLIGENKSLRQQQETLVSDRANLIEKNELAKSRVESMITRLRSLEARS